MDAFTPPQAQNNPMGHIFELQKYPIGDAVAPLTQALIARTRSELETIGCAVVRGFVKPQSLSRMQAEAARKLDSIHWMEDCHNPYFSKDDPALPPDHPERRFEQRRSGYITSDVLDPDSDLSQIFNSRLLIDFLSACLGISPLYCWADPIANHPYSVMRCGDYFPWHFDGNEFTVSILVQESESGGIFEFAPNLRSPGNDNYGGIKYILGGGRKGVNCLQLRAGDMQIFKGRFSMHRVTTVSGNQQRIIALPSYSTDRLTMNRPEHSKQVYGKALPIHYAREAHRIDNLND